MKSKTLPATVTLIAMQCLLTATLIAQTTPPPKQWDKRFGGIGDDWFYSLQQTTDGGYILGGGSTSGIGGDKTEDSRGASDYWIAKINANGIKQWDKRYGGSGIDGLMSLQQTKDGGYILGGQSDSQLSGDITQSNRGGYDYWVVKIDINGAKQWDKRFGGTGSDHFSSLQQTTDGGYILGGYSGSGIGGDKTEDSRGNDDYWIVKIDANGIKQWDKRFGGTGNDALQSLQQTSDGGYILGGYSSSGIDGDKTQANWAPSNYSPDYWVVKTDANGIKQWDKRFGGTYLDVLYCLRQTIDGGYILGGYSESGIGGDKTEKSRGNSDFWIVKIDANGIKQWDKRFGGSSVEYFQSLQQTTDGGYILGGTSDSYIGGDKSEASQGDYDYWIVKTNANGIKQWDKRFGGHIQDYLYSLEQTTDGGYILGGMSDSRIGGDKTQTLRGSYDYWAVKIGCPPEALIVAAGDLDICTTGSVVLHVNATDTMKYQWLRDNKKIKSGTNAYFNARIPGEYKVIVYTDRSCRNISNALTVTISCGPVASNNTSDLQTSNLQPSTISVYPNPSKGNITIAYSSSTSGQVQLTIFDITGKKLFNKTVQAIAGNNTYPLNLTHLAPGIYNLQLVNGAEKKDIRFVIEK